MTQDPLTLYKLIVLYMLDKVTFKLSYSQISSFILEKEYTNFITLQQVIADLQDTELIKADTSMNRTLFSITEEGRSTLSYFGNRIGDAIIADIVEGMVGTDTEYVVVENRIDAIRFAMDHARPGDVILLAGKGHETYQIVGHEKRHLDEREVVAAYIQELQQQERA